MNISQKCQYALRAVLELAKRSDEGPTPVGQIAKAQAVPPKFLELILRELRQGGFVESRRGVQGGYLLTVPPSVLRVGRVVRFVDGPLAPVRCLAGETESDCPLRGNCAFMGLWSRASEAVAQVYDGTTFQDLIDEEEAARNRYVPSYCI